MNILKLMAKDQEESKKILERCCQFTQSSVRLNELVLLRLQSLPSQRQFHAAVIPFNDDRFICLYHNSGSHDLASCFLDQNLHYVDGSICNRIFDTINADPRIMSYKGKYFVSTSRYDVSPIRIELGELQVSNGIITIVPNSRRMFTNIMNWPGYSAKTEKNWTPWEHVGKIYYTHSLNPHIILEMDIEGDSSLKVVASTKWTTDSWWSRESWEFPTYRLNCPPIRLQDGTYLSVFHTMRFASCSTPWHKIVPNHIRCYWTGFYLFEGLYPHRVLKISKEPFVSPLYVLPIDWPFHPPPSGGNPFWPFSMIIRGDRILLTGGSNEISTAFCFFSLNEVLQSLTPVSQEE